MIVLVDNYDSFVHNLARHFERLGQETLVLRNDATSAAAIRALAPAAVVISPGPFTPAESGCSLEVVRDLHRDVSILGVCLGHQTIAAALGARIVRAVEPMHGRTSRVTHDGSELFLGVASPFAACRYHSLVVEESSLPAALRVTARSDDGTIMALAHVERPVFGVQFHPEAILTDGGYQILANFLRIAGCPVPADPAKLARAEFAPPPAPAFVPPLQPVTF